MHFSILFHQRPTQLKLPVISKVQYSGSLATGTAANAGKVIKQLSVF